jgi:hypothetical protein
MIGAMQRDGLGVSWRGPVTIVTIDPPAARSALGVPSATRLREVVAEAAGSCRTEQRLTQPSANEASGGRTAVERGAERAARRAGG